VPKVYNKHHAGVPDDAVCIERGTDYGNPFRVTATRNRAKAIAEYRDWLLAQPKLVEQVQDQLAGKNLVCGCAPKPCHGDVLLALANGIDS